MAQLSEEKRDEFWKYYEQFVRAAGKDAAMCNDRGMVFLTDWDGFSLKNYATTTGKSVFKSSSWADTHK